MTSAPVTAAQLPAAGVLQLTGSLLLVLALIFAITWAVKRLQLVRPRRSRSMSVLDELALSPRERVVLLQVGQSQWLLGVGPSGLTPLAPLSIPVELPADAAAPTFAERLRELLQRPGAGA